MDRPPATSLSNASRSGGDNYPGDPSVPTTLDDNVRRLIRAFLDRSPLSDEEFGRLVVGDSRLIAGLDKGCPLTLEMADRLLRLMGEAPIGPTFRSEVTAYLAITGTRGSSLGEKTVGNRSFVSRLKSGKSPLLSDVQKVRARMRRTVSEEQRAALALAIADDGQAGWELSPDPGAIEALVDGPGSDASDDKVPGDRSSAKQELDAFLTAREAAVFLRLSSRTLDGYRYMGRGPAYHVFGNKVVYARADLLSWAWTKRRGLYHEAL